jgi:hypothetical protein
VKFKPEENLPVSSTAILASAGHDVDTVTHEGLIGAPDRDVVTSATAAGRILILLDRGVAARSLGVSGPMLSTQAIQPRAPRSACIPPEPSLAAADADVYHSTFAVFGSGPEIEPPEGGSVSDLAG